MAESQRPSRQDLVVPPQGSSLPMVLGALVCAAAGFGLVWSLGIGRSSGGFTLPFATHATMPDGSLPTAVIDAADPAAPLAADAVPRTFADDPMPGLPRRFPAIDDAGATPAAGQRGWPASPAAAAPPSADERYPTRPPPLGAPERLTHEYVSLDSQEPRKTREPLLGEPAGGGEATRRRWRGMLVRGPSSRARNASSRARSERASTMSTCASRPLG